MNIRYHVELVPEAERRELTALVGAAGIAPASSNEPRSCSPPTAGSATTISPRPWAVGGWTVYRTKRRFVEGNLEAALNEEPRVGADRKLTSNEEALLVATACSSPPPKVAPAGPAGAAGRGDGQADRP